MSKDDALLALLARERQRLARDVHDALGGDLAAIKMALAVLGRRLPPEPGLHDQLAYADKLVDGAIDAMHRVVDGARQAPSGKLEQVLAQELASFARQSGLACRTALAETRLDMRAPPAQALFYILRESLGNIGKHARATQVRVALRVTNDRLSLEIEDDGAGIGSIASARKGWGLESMQERAEEQGGEFSIRSIAPHGTLIVIEIPLGNTRT
jgi:signal transduction histidine kinase